MNEQDQGVFQHVNPLHIFVERVAGLIYAVALGGIILITDLVLFFSGMTSIFYLVMYAAALAYAGMTFVIKAVWPGISYRYTFWRLNEDGLEIRRGVFWRHQISVPRARVQHADVSQGPLQRQYGIARLTVHTAGTLNASVVLNGLTHSMAIELRNQLVRQGKEIHVV
ncbi:MAG: PH domain-containing protein [Mariniblastus sp.]|nr:PH domain-containing protein [Mariniblastus sp.]